MFRNVIANISQRSSRVLFNPNVRKNVSSSSSSSPLSNGRQLLGIAGLAGVITGGAFVLWNGKDYIFKNSLAEEQVDASKTPALSPKEFRAFTVDEIYPISHDTKRYRFQLNDPEQPLGLTVASCLMVQAPAGENGKNVVRPYTPCTETNDVGFFDLIVKEYPNGVLSKYFASLEPGQQLQFKGPFPKLQYTPNMKKRIGMVAGGTGITPMLQIVSHALRDNNDNTEITLVFANKSEQDILLKQEIDALARRHKNFKVHYIVDKATTKYWKGDVGFITEDLIKKYLPPPSDENMILVCGPPGLMNHVSGDKAKDYSQGEVSGLLKKLGYKENQVYKF